MNIGMACIADPAHVHWYSFHFADSEMLGKFRTMYEEGLDLVEAHRLRHTLRLEMIADIIRTDEVK